MASGKYKTDLDAMKYLAPAQVNKSDLYHIYNDMMQAQQAHAGAQQYGMLDLTNAQMIVNDPGHHHSVAAGQIYQLNVHEHARSMLFSRLNGLAGSTFAIRTNDFIWPHVTGDKVYVFFVCDNKAGHLEDQSALFPSDKLITQIRLLWSS